MLLNECVNEYIDYQLSEGKDYNKTIKKYVSNINEMIEYLNVNTVEELDNITYIEMKMQWINKKKEEGLSNQSINLRIASVRSFLEYMVGMRYIHENVANHIHKEKTTARKATIDENKIKQMLELVDKKYCLDPCFKTCRDRFMIYTLLFTGLRSMELRDISLSDITLDGKFAVVGKYSKKRIVTLPTKLLKMHQEYLCYRNQLPSLSNKLFVSINGKDMDKNTPNRIIKEISHSVGLDDWTGHSTRKSTITTLINSGVPVEKVASIVGHQSTSTTLKSYYCPNANDIQESVNKNKLLNIM